jgi:hypothetical protein
MVIFYSFLYVYARLDLVSIQKATTHVEAIVWTMCRSCHDLNIPLRRLPGPCWSSQSVYIIYPATNNYIIMQYNYTPLLFINNHFNPMFFLTQKRPFSAPHTRAKAQAVNHQTSTKERRRQGTGRSIPLNKWLITISIYLISMDWFVREILQESPIFHRKIDGFL